MRTRGQCPILAVERAGLALATSLVLASAPTAPARADDAYICDGGRMLYAKPETLAKFQASNVDPCSGRPLDPSRPFATPSPARVNPPAPRPVTPSPVTPGLKRPEQAASNHADRLQSDVSTPPRSAAAPSPKAAEPSRVSAPAAVRLDGAASGYRYVPILNAAPGSPAVFRHIR